MQEQRATTSRPGLRERKKADTRFALRSAALELSRATRPDEVSIEAICERAGVAKRTFFNYFASKDEAIIGWSDDVVGYLTETLVRRPREEDLLTALEVTLTELVGATTAGEIWLQQLELLRMHPELLSRLAASSKRMETFVCEALAQRSGRTRNDPELVLMAAISVTALRVTLGRWLDSPAGTDARLLLGEAFAALRNGMHIS